MQTEIITIPCLQDNFAYIIHNQKLNETFLIDAPESLPIITVLEKNNWRLKKIILTHHHSDHIMGAKDLKEKYNSKLVGAHADMHRLPKLDKKIKVEQILDLGGLKFETIDVPGHTIGHLAYYCKKIGVLFTGDSLMAFGCGRLFEGTPAMMWKTLKKFKKLPLYTKIYSGHEYTIKNLEFALSVDTENIKIKKKLVEVKDLIKNNLPSVPTTIKDELEINPFLRANSLEIKKHLNMETDTDENVFTELRNRRDVF